VSSTATEWLHDAVFYEIYPQSFADAGGDGIGDLPGVLARLDHVAWLGANVIWFNPCFSSPFRDAGYDVSDYLKVAPRYGTNEDLVAVVDAARERGIRVVLDLVAGHTSVEHAWFRAAARDTVQDSAQDSAQGSAQGSAEDVTGDRYVWADRQAAGFVPSPGPRPGYYLKNFYDEQPALNFGYARMDASEPWRQRADAPGPQANRAALRDIMAFWLDRGVAGFRIDMALSLVKDDPGYVATMQLWREMREWLDTAYPGAVIIPEGMEPLVIEPDGAGQVPPKSSATRAVAFHGDFVLVIDEAHCSLFDNGGAGSLPWVPSRPCFFDAAGEGSPSPFLRFWERRRAALGPDRPVLLASADHDFSRLACGDRTAEQLGAAWTFLLTWGSVPSIYYGDEIGLRYQTGMPDKEGSVCHPTYNRAGARTPMQWDDAANAGFSTAPPDRLYLPVDPDPQRPTVASQLADEGSVLHLVRRLVALRRETPELSPPGSTVVLHEGYPLVYLRGGTHLVVVNPRREPVDVDLPELPRLSGGDGGIATGVSGVEVRGVEVEDGMVHADGFGYGVFLLGARRYGDPLPPHGAGR